MIKDQLIKKAKQLTERLLVAFNAEIRESIEQVNDDFSAKLERLQVRSLVVVIIKLIPPSIHFALSLS
jgi:hypothetical protein